MKLLLIRGQIPKGDNDMPAESQLSESHQRPDSWNASSSNGRALSSERNIINYWSCESLLSLDSWNMSV